MNASDDRALPRVFQKSFTLLTESYESSRRSYSRPSSGLKLESMDSNPSSSFVSQDQVAFKNTFYRIQAKAFVLVDTIKIRKSKST